MEDVAYYAFWIGFAAACVASLAYWASTIGSWKSYGLAATNAVSVSMPVGLSFPQGLGAVGTAVSWVSLLALTVSLAARAVASERPPLGNLWEFTVAFGWGVTLFTVVFEKLHDQRSVSAFVLPIAVAIMAVAVLFFPPEIGPLVPALQANRILAIHVSVMVLAYASLTVSFGAAVMYLLQAKGNQKRFGSLPNLETLEDVGYWSVLVGFPLLALGLALGAYWANSAWGRYWGWDPKETSALMTWFIYAVYLHARNLNDWQGKRSAILLIVGYAAVLFTYFAVNFLIFGLHSYGGV